MANTKSAAKRARQTERRTASNRPVLTGVRNQLKAVRLSLKAGKIEESKVLVQGFVSAIDKAAKTGRVHQNAANRHKSALARALAALGSGTPSRSDASRVQEPETLPS